MTTTLTLPIDKDWTTEDIMELFATTPFLGVEAEEAEQMLEALDKLPSCFGIEVSGIMIACQEPGLYLVSHCTTHND